MRRFVLFIAVLALLAGSNAAQAALDVNIEVQEFTLENGMLFLVVERPATPQVAVRLAVRAGSAHEETGKTGIAHLLEHMMFKGTKNFGTLDYEKDQRLQARIEAAYQEILAEKAKRNPDPEIIRSKREEMKSLRAQVQKIFVPQAFSSQLGKNGAVGINAFTTKDQTQYVASVPSDMLEQWFSIASEQIFEPAWREFYVEKEVVQREWAFRYVNNPAGAAWVDLEATAYSAHPYRNPTIGWKSDMEHYSTSAARDFHRRHYNPTNAVCVLVGDVAMAKARRLAQTYFARYPAGRRTAEFVTEEPPQQGPRRSVRYLKGARTPLVRIGFHGARMGSPDFYALDVLTLILSEGRSARLNRELVQKGLAQEAWAYNPDSRYASLVVLGGTPNESNGDRHSYLEACRKLEALLLEQIRRLESEPVTPEELARVKKLNERSFLERMRSNENLAGTLATLEVQVGWPYLNSYLEQIAKVTPDDVRRVARTYFDPDNQTSTYVVPGGQPEKPPVQYSEQRTVSGAAAVRLPNPGTDQNHSRYPTPEGWKHPLSFDREPEKIRYPEAQKLQIGNTDVFFLPDDELPLVDLTLFVRAGQVDVPKEKTGLADVLSASLVDGGTESHSPAELSRLLDANAIRLSVSIGEEMSQIRLSVLKDDWKQGLALLREVLTQPRFESRILAVVKRQALTGLQRQGEDAQKVAFRESLVRHFEGHPYGRDPLTGLDTIPAIESRDLRGFLRAYFVPANMVLAVSGDVSRATVESGVRTLLASLPAAPAPARELPAPSPTPAALALIHKAGQVQSQVVMTLPAIERTDPDFWKLRLLTDLFGGNDSLMYTRLRDDLGLVYSAGFFQTWKWDAGILMGYIGCRADRTTEAIAETVSIMKRLQETIPPEVFRRKRLESLNSFVFNVDTPSALVDVYAQYRLRGEPLDTLEHIQEAYIESTPSQLRRLAEVYLRPEALQIVVVADKTIAVKDADGKETTLEADLKAAAEHDRPGWIDDRRVVVRCGSPHVVNRPTDGLPLAPEIAQALGRLIPVRLPHLTVQADGIQMPRIAGSQQVGQRGEIRRQAAHRFDDRPFGLPVSLHRSQNPNPTLELFQQCVPGRQRWFNVGNLVVVSQIGHFGRSFYRALQASQTVNQVPFLRSATGPDPTAGEILHGFELHLASLGHLADKPAVPVFNALLEDRGDHRV